MSTVDLSKDFTFIVLFLIIVISTFIIRAFIIRKKAEKLNTPLFILSLYAISVCLILCLISARIGIYKIVTTGNPTDTVTLFYDSVIIKDYNTAYSCLNNSNSLGLDNSVSNNDIANSKILTALEKSYSYSISENAIVSGLNAVQRVNFTYLDLNKIQESISDNIDPVLNSKIESLPRNELYTDDGHYQKSLMDSIYNEAVDKALKNVTDYYVTLSYDVTLEYNKGSWFLNINDDMIRGFSGGK